jgi:A/G-specific adenine glycosylase
MLQQTQIATGLPYYERWMARFPTVQVLAEATEQEAMALWQGLGYYRRCRMLLKAAKLVADEGFPISHDSWQKIPGVGPYTAAAIASICLDEPTAVVDGNVERVHSRMTCDPETGSKLKANTWIWAQKHLVSESPGEWNQAIMELGATVCKPNQPQCGSCPVRQSCVAYQTNEVDNFPVPKPKPTITRYREEILIPIFGVEVGIVETHSLNWWQGLSLLPLVSQCSHEIENKWLEHLGEIQYTVTNHKITAAISCYQFEVRPPNLKWISKNEIDSVPVPAPHRKALRMLYKT